MIGVKQPRSACLAGTAGRQRDREVRLASQPHHRRQEGSKTPKTAAKAMRMGAAAEHLTESKFEYDAVVPGRTAMVSGIRANRVKTREEQAFGCSGTDAIDRLRTTAS